MELHPGVCLTTVLVAHPAVRPGSVHLGEDRVVLSRVGVNLALQLRHPEAVDHIRGLDVKVDRHTGRNVNLVRRDHSKRRVLELPPPLMTNGVDI